MNIKLGTTLLQTRFKEDFFSTLNFKKMCITITYSTSTEYFHEKKTVKKF